ncbi:unnamed protein product [Diamesa tonsa]
MILIRKFTGCCDLRYGAIILGSISAFLGFLSALEFTPVLTNYNEAVEQMKMEKPDFEFDYFEFKAVVQLLFLGLLIFAVSFMICSILMIIGAAKSNPKMILPWIICNIVITLLTLFAAIVFLDLIYFSIAIILSYFIISMYSLYKHLQMEITNNLNTEYTADGLLDWDVPHSGGNYNSSVQYVTKQYNPSPMCPV